MWVPACSGDRMNQGQIKSSLQYSIFHSIHVCHYMTNIQSTSGAIQFVLVFLPKTTGIQIFVLTPKIKRKKAMLSQQCYTYTLQESKIMFLRGGCMQVRVSWCFMPIASTLMPVLCLPAQFSVECGSHSLWFTLCCSSKFCVILSQLYIL